MSTGSWQQAHPARVHRLRRLICSTVLVAQALVVFFAALVAMRLSSIPGPILALATATLVLGCLLLAGLMGRPWAVLAGSVWQGVCLACSVVLPAFALLMVIFVGLWVAGLLVVRHIAATAVPTTH